MYTIIIVLKPTTTLFLFFFICEVSFKKVPEGSIRGHVLVRDF